MKPINNDQTLIQQLKRKFYIGSLDFESEAKDICNLSWYQQEDFLNDTVNDSLTKIYPMKSEFTRLFFKKLIDCLEKTQEVHDDLYKYLCLTMSSETDSFYYRHYIIGDNLWNRIVIRETDNLVVNGTTGMRTWEAALMLVDWALQNKGLFENKYVLELGSGVGFAGITIAKFCHPHTVLMSDYHEDVLNTAEDNININFPGLKRQTSSFTRNMFTETDLNIGVMNLDWIDPSNVSHELCPDVIVGADIIYDPTILEPLCNTLALFFQKNRNVDVYLAGVNRNEQTFHQFLRKIEAADFRIENIHHDENVFIQWNRNIKTYLIKVKL